VVFAIPGRGNRLRVAASPAGRPPLPSGAETIARVEGADLNMMPLWAKRRAKRGRGLEKMKAACE
jgi:hypothetical protein